MDDQARREGDALTLPVLHTLRDEAADHAEAVAHGDVVREDGGEGVAAVVHTVIVHPWSDKMGPWRGREEKNFS